MTDPAIKAIAPWFGGKRQLAPLIVEELGPHKSFWDPFCGGMSILLAKPHCSHEHVNDLHGDLINLARTIADPHFGAALYRDLRRTLQHEALFEESKERLARPPVANEFDPEAINYSRAFDYFLVSWMGRNGVSGTARVNQTYAVRYTSGGGHGAVRFNSAVASIPAWRRRMRGVTILSCDAFNLLEKIDDQDGTAIYVDPPYIEKSNRYEHDFDQHGHERLAKLLQRFERARVVVSYYDHPMLGNLYAGWTQRHLDARKNLAQHAKRGSKKKLAPEVLLLNGPSYAAKENDLFTSKDAPSCTSAPTP